MKQPQESASKGSKYSEHVRILKKLSRSNSRRLRAIHEYRGSNTKIQFLNMKHENLKKILDGC